VEEKMPISFKEYGHGESANPHQLRSARRARGYSEADLAMLIGTTPIMVNAWEEGMQVLPKEMLFRYVKVLNFPEGFFTKWPACPRCKCVVEGSMPTLNTLVIHEHLDQDDEEYGRQRLDRLEEKLDRLLAQAPKPNPN
jgi:transcriptional regulator with XRE-family HTH domain